MGEQKKYDTYEDVLNRIKKKAKYASTDISDVNDDYIKSFMADSQKYFDDAQGMYDAINWGNASTTYDERNASWQALAERANKVGAYYYRNRKKYKNYDDIASSIDEILSGGANQLTSFSNLKDYYSQWDSQEAYDTWKAEDDLYNSIRKNYDYANMVEKGKNTMLAPKVGIGGLDLEGYNDYVNDRKRMEQYLNDDELGIYYYYLGSGKTKEAEDYFKKYSEVAKYRAAEGKAEKWNNTHLGELAMAFGSGVDSFVSGMKNLNAAVNTTLWGVETDVTTPTVSQYGYGIMSADNKGIDKVAVDSAQTIANQLPSIAVGGFIPGAGNVVMGMSAAGNAYAQMSQVEGVSKQQALNYGITIGVLEGVLQKVMGGISGLGSDGGFATNAIQKALPNITSALGKFALTTGANMVEEGFEEALQEVLDPIVQGIMTGTVSDDQDEIFEILSNASYSFLLGAVSAGTLEGIPSFANSVSTTRKANKQYSKISSDIVAEILEKNPNDSFALKMQGKLNQGKKLSGGNVAALVERGDRTAIESAIANKLTERGERGDISQLSQVLAKEAMGYGLSKAETRLIQSSDFGRSIQAELNPNNLSNQGEIDRWAEKIGTREVNPKQYNKQVEVKEIKEDGKVELESGKVIDAKSVSFNNEADEIIFKTATERVGRVDGWTNESANAMVKGYDGNVSALEYRQAYVSAFDMGKNGAEASQIVALANQTGIKGSTLLAAYDMGKQATEKALTNDTDSGKIESEVKTDESTGLRLRDSSKRDGGKDSQKQVSGVEESTGRDTSREDTERKVADSEAVKLVNEGRKVKVSELGILNGSKTQTVTVVDKSQETSEMKKARKEAEKRGLKVRFFLGDNLVIEENGELISVRGYIKGEYVFVRADHPLYTSYQLIRHEIGHDMIAKGEVDINKVRAKLEETVGKENIDAVADMYASAYERSGLDADAIWEECICDSLGDMNVFSDFADIDQGIITMVLGDIKQATEDTKTAPNKTRGAPEGKASQEKRAKYFSYNQLGTKIATHIENELKQFYGDIDNAIADEIAFEYGNRVYIVDSTKDNGEIRFGVRKKFYEIDDDNGRKLFIREKNYESISEDRVSDELSQKLRGQDANNRGSDRQQELGEELRIDTGKSSNNQGGIFESIEDRRGVEPSELVKQLRQKLGIEEGKTSREINLDDDLLLDALFGDDWSDLDLFGGDITIEDISEELNTTPEKVEVLFYREGLGDSYIEDGHKAVMTQARIDEAIDYNGATNPRYARRLITRISPKDFIDLTVMRANQDRTTFDTDVLGDHGNIMGEYNYANALKESRANPYLVVDITSGRVIGHNGRHRMRAMELLGIDSVEIEVELYDDGIVKYHDGILKDLAISSQFDTKTQTHLSSLIPLNESYRSDIEARYGEKAHPNANVKYSRETPDEARMSGKVSDAQFSREFASDIASNQLKRNAKDSKIDSKVLDKAISDAARMVEIMTPFEKLLPRDMVGKTLVKNGSYDISVENTTICIRTLAYNSFVDMVSEKVGRPLTQMESFLVSQKLYEIAKEPQCLYCYVSLDRKAFNEMIIRYTTQRDEAIAAYEEAGSPRVPKAMDENWSLFKEFLDGRKPTKNMWDRYVGWLEAYNKGERLVTLEDISTEAKRLAIVEGKDVNAAAQVKDMLKYAQSASWAKKQTQYVAYYNDILKLSDNVVKNLNSHYGLRWYSFSDYSGAFILENMQQITDAAIRGLKGLSYTKDTDFAEIFAPTGMNINISVYAKKGKNGYEIDEKQSADIKKAIKLREKYPNIGIVVVATDKAGVEWALAQEWSDVVIPFHTVRTGADVAEFYNWEIFNAEQNDVVSDDNLWDAYVKSTGKKKVSKMVYPNEHQNNRETYLRICKQRGLTPRFKSFLDNPNYMKLVNETRQSESATKPLKPIYDMDAAERSFGKFVEKGGYYEGWYNDGIDVDGEADIVASDVLSGKKANEVSYGRQDVSFEDIAKGRKTNRTHGKASRELDIEGDSAVDTKPLSNRELLANALLDTVQNEVEYKKLDDYKAVIGYLEAEETKLASLKKQIREATFGNGDKTKLKELNEEARKTEARIDLHDKKLLQLESTQALKNVLERAKKEAYSKALAKGRETLHANVEGRHKTAIRNQIKDNARKLATLLNKGSKEKNIKAEEQPIVRALLDITDRMFATDDELIIGGIETDTTPREDNAIATFKELYNEYHSYDDTITENKEKRKELRSQMNEIKNEITELLYRERNRISKAKAATAFDVLIRAYEGLQNERSSYLSGAFEEDTLNYLKVLKNNVGDTVVQDMTLGQLNDLYKAVKMIKKMVTDSNKMFRDGQYEDLEKIVDPIFSELEQFKGDRPDLPNFAGKVVSKGEEFTWKNLRPVDMFKRIGSKTLDTLFWDVIKAQDTYGKNVEEIGKAITDARKKHGYNKWDVYETQTIGTIDGAFKVTLGEMMSIYAYSKREQASKHILEGGFTHEEGARYKDSKGKLKIFKTRREKAHPNRMNELMVAEVAKSLTAEQRDYVDELVNYITKYGEKGNEVSRILYGIDLFTEKAYFPLKSSRDFLSSTKTEIGKTQTTSSLANTGMTKPTTPGANNPIVLRQFDDVILEHLDTMSKYNAYVIPIKNLRKVYDWVDRDNDISFKTLLSSKHGKAASDVLMDYITDLNGGVSAPKGFLAKLFSRSKAASVMAKNSVWVQQYFSIIRAMETVNPKYFIPYLGESYKNPNMKLYEEMKRYAPITTIKEMGGFDVGSNRGIADYIGLNETKFSIKKGDKILQDIFGFMPSAMDKLGWMTIWKAVKKEVAASNKYKLGSDEYLNACGKRMAEVVTLTQVYDSVNARSGFMRSKNALDQFATSFMGEPTVIVGRIYISAIELKRAVESGNKSEIEKAKSTFVKVATTIAIANAMTSVAKSLIYAGFDDDDDETYGEKYVSALASAFADDINVFGYIPYARDISSILDGFTVDRPDMQLIEGLINAIEDMFDGNLSDVTLDEVVGLLGSFAFFATLPIKNIYKDIKGLANTVESIGRDYKDNLSKQAGVGLASGNWITKGISNIVKVDTKYSKSKRLYDAMARGDEARIEYFASTYKTYELFESAVRKSLRDNDSRLEEAALAKLNNDSATYNELLQEVLNEGIFDREIVIEAFKAEYNYQKRKLEEESE